MFLLISTFIVSVLYFLIILIFIRGWKNTFSFEPKGDIELDVSVSVIVPCKNEQDNILKLISCLAQQSYQNFELIIVNDHSSDLTLNYIKNAQNFFPKIQLINANGFGKKNALKEGILLAKSELILTTDADCLPTYHWIEAIVSFQHSFPSAMIIGPVGIKDNKSIFSRLQALEFVSLVGAAAGSTGVGSSILCNGANLAFQKKEWLKCQKNLHEKEQSGDDIFLLEELKKRGAKIRFLKSEAAFVKTMPQIKLSDFIKQRRRWTSKSKLYTDWQIILTACVIFGMSTLSLLLLLFSIYKTAYLIGFIAVFIFKFAIDTRFLYLIRRFFQLENIWFYSFILSLIYPFYIIFIALSAWIIPSKTWK